MVETIIIPPQFQDPHAENMRHANNDNVAILHAVAVLFPFKVRQLLLPPFEEGKISIQEIAEKIVDLPPKYVATVMSHRWETIYDLMMGE